MQPITVRASSIGALFDCPARWISINIEKRRTPTRSTAAIGTAIHAGTAVFDSDRVARQIPNLGAAMDAAAESINKPREEIAWDEDSPAKAVSVATSLTERYCTLESHKHEFVAVEASVDSLHITDLGLILTGQVDRVRAEDGQYGISDLKSGKSAVGTDGKAKTQGHGAQLGVYELVAEAATGLPIRAPAQVIGLQTNLTPEKQRIGTAEVIGVRDVLLGDGETPGLLAIASRIIHGDMPAWGNPKSMMCHKTYCPNFNTCFWRR